MVDAPALVERLEPYGPDLDERIVAATLDCVARWGLAKTTLDDIARAAFGRGALAAVLPGTKVCWMVDPHGPACPDAEDNALAGEVAAGQPFPTGDVSAPAHEGCRCMLALAPR